jgi:hypothetical protein
MENKIKLTNHNMKINKQTENKKDEDKKYKE